MAHITDPVHVPRRTGPLSCISFSGGTPRTDNIHSFGGISTVLQSARDCEKGRIQGDVPENDVTVYLSRVGSGSVAEHRIAGSLTRATYRVGEGCLMEPGTDSRWIMQEDVAGGWFHIHFDRGMLKQFEDSEGMRIGTLPIITDPGISSLSAMFFELVSGTEEPDPLLWQSLGQVLLWRLLLLTAGKRRHEANGGLAAWQARRTTEYLADNIGRKVTLDELAAIARLSPFHFARAFARTVGMPPYRYQQKLRLDRARELLGQTDMRVIDVALAVGYESQQALSRVFSQQFGVTPSQWRRLHSA